MSFTALLRRLAPAAIAPAVFAMVSCGGAADDRAADGTVTVGFSKIGAESAWRTAESASIRGEAEARGIVLKLSDAQQKQENQIKALRNFIAGGPDATSWSSPSTASEARSRR